MVPKNTIANLLQRGICFVAVHFNVSCILGNTCCILGNTCCILGNAVCYIRTSNRQIARYCKVSVGCAVCHSYIAAAVCTEGTGVVPDAGCMDFTLFIYGHSGCIFIISFRAIFFINTNLYRRCIVGSS